MVCKHHAARHRIPVLDGIVGTKDGQEVVQMAGLALPIVGYLNCTGHPLPGDAENSRRIREFLDARAKGKTP
jgi:hypothetical protein